MTGGSRTSKATKCTILTRFSVLVLNSSVTLKIKINLLNLYSTQDKKSIKIKNQQQDIPVWPNYCWRLHTKKFCATQLQHVPAATGMFTSIINISKQCINSQLYNFKKMKYDRIKFFKCYLQLHLIPKTTLISPPVSAPPHKQCIIKLEINLKFFESFKLTPNLILCCRGGPIRSELSDAFVS